METVIQQGNKTIFFNMTLSEYLYILFIISLQWNPIIKAVCGWDQIAIQYSPFNKATLLAKKLWPY